MVAQEYMWLERLIGEMLCKLIILFKLDVDNETVVKLASNPLFHGRTKHIEVRHHYIREEVLDHEVVFERTLYKLASC